MTWSQAFVTICPHRHIFGLWPCQRLGLEKNSINILLRQTDALNDDIVLSFKLNSGI